MVNKNRKALVAVISLLTASLYAYTDINAPSISFDENGIGSYRVRAGTAVAIDNTATIATKMKYRGVNLSNSKPGLKNELQGSFYRGPMHLFLKLDMFGFTPYQNPQATEHYSVTQGATMTGSAMGGEIFFNKCHSSGFKVARGIYQWPGARSLQYRDAGYGSGMALKFNNGNPLVKYVKPVKVTDLTLLWRSFRFVGSKADVTSSTSTHGTTPKVWPFTWDDYISVETPKFKMTEKINMKARYGYWKSNGIEINADFSTPLSKNIDSILKVYSFKSFLWTQGDKIGVVLMMKFKTAGKLNITLPSFCG